jgi:5-methylcytosine-specific restriction endonuclease McrA
MNTEVLVKEFYNVYSQDFPTQRERSKWKAENKCGFLLGIIQHGVDSHALRLYHLLQTNEFKVQEDIFIDEMYQYYIYPFKQYNGSTSGSRTPDSSQTPSRRSSAEDLDYTPQERELSHRDLKKAVEKRDGVCLFCWNRLECQVAHIISQKNPMVMTMDQYSIFLEAGLTQKHQVQNGLLLCSVCHGQFDKLKRYVDLVDGKLVVKLITESNDITSEKYRYWKEIVRMQKFFRSGWQETWTEVDNRQAVDSNGEMALYFVDNNPTLLPNRKALEFHKTACLIWQMAGGAESDEEFCPDEEYIRVDYKSKDIHKWIQDTTDSGATMNIELG